MTSTGTSAGDPDRAVGGDPRRSVSRINLLIAATAATIGLIYGYDLGSIAAAILFLQPDFGLSDTFVGILTAAVVLGQLVGAFFGGRIANAIGRRRAVIYVAIGYAAFAAMQGLAPDPYTLTAARFLLGLAIGVSIIAAPAFIAESAPVRIRGSMLVGFQIATTSGIVIAYGVGVLLAPSESWRLILSLSAIPALLVLALLRRLPDTPRWYLMAGRREDALRTLRMTDPDQDAEEEARVIERDLRHEERGSFSELFQGHFRKAAVFVIGLGFFVQITGINAIVYYSPTIFQRVGVESPTNAILVAGLIQLAGVAAEVCAFLVVDRWGRRPTLLSGISVMIAANGILIFAFSSGPSAVLAFVGILLFTVGFSFGYGSLVWVYASESFPSRLRTQGASAMLTADLFANFLIGVLFPNALGALGGSVTFGIFLVLSVVALVFIYRLAPETKGRQLEDIRAYWYNGGRWSDRSDGGAPDSRRPAPA